MMIVKRTLFKASFIFSLSLFITSCVPIFVGGGAFVTTLATREKGIMGTANDSKISLAVKSKLYSYNIDIYSQVVVNVQNAEVLLIGAVTNPEWITETERLVWQVREVKHVHNHLAVLDKNSPSAAKDSWITSQIKTNLFFANDVRSLNYSIKTVNGIVYIMGIAQNQKELDYITKYASCVKDVKQVVSYAQIKDVSQS
ncbi:MAG: BON domain-containing protein [Alphaproteobacteria bacterium]